MTDKPPEGVQFCLYVDETMLAAGGYIPAAVYEDTSGFWPMIGSGEFAEPWYFGHDLAQARLLCEKSNAGRGITAERATQIVASSIRASIAEDARRQEALNRLDRIKKGLPAWPPRVW